MADDLKAEERLCSLMHPGPYWALGPFTRKDERMLRPYMRIGDLGDHPKSQQPGIVMEVAGSKALELIDAGPARSNSFHSDKYMTVVYDLTRVALCERLGTRSRGFQAYFVGPWHEVDFVRGGMTLLYASKGLYADEPHGYITNLLVDRTAKRLSQDDVVRFADGLYHSKTDRAGRSLADDALSQVGISRNENVRTMSDEEQKKIEGVILGIREFPHVAREIEKSKNTAHSA